MPDTKESSLCQYVLRLGDNCLILGQQISAWCGHAPALEEDIAIANISLDLIGQATLWLDLAASISQDSTTADNLAFLRDEREFRNVLLVEQPNEDFGQTLMRQYIFDSWHHAILKELTGSANQKIAAIAAKSIKEVSYHLERSRDLVIRLGRGTKESHDRLQGALNRLWRFSDELCKADDLDIEMRTAKVGADLDLVKADFDQEIETTLRHARLKSPENVFMRSGGKMGVHTEHLGPLLAEMQFLQRAYPGQVW